MIDVNSQIRLSDVRSGNLVDVSIDVERQTRSQRLVHPPRVLSEGHDASGGVDQIGAELCKEGFVVSDLGL